MQGTGTSPESGSIKVAEDQKDEADNYEQIVADQQKRTGKVSNDDFTLLQVIGTGSYGKVLLVKKKETGKLYAMKVLKKSYLKKQKQIEHTMDERKILEKINSPFIIKLNYAY
jgi:serum/glucocorticoid-regulated kinase 2